RHRDGASMHLDPPASPLPDDNDSPPAQTGLKAGLPDLPLPAIAIDDDRPWYKTLNGYQWFVFIVCCLAWDMDCMDQQLFNLARRPAMIDLVRKVAKDDPRLPEFRAKLSAKAAADGKPAPEDTAVLAAVQNADIQEAAG